MGDEGEGVPATCPLFHPERLKQSPQGRVRGGKEVPGARGRLGGVFEQSGGVSLIELNVRVARE